MRELYSEQEEFIDALYREMFRKMYHYAYSILNQPALVEDAVQEAFRIACIKTDCLISSESPQGWMINTLKNVIRNIRQKEEYQRRVIVDSVIIEDYFSPMGVEDDYSEVEFSDLASDEDHYLLKSVILYKKTILEIAEELGISPEACKKRLQRAKTKLKNKLEFCK